MRMRERIAEGKLFLDNCQNLPKERLLAKSRMVEFNQSPPEAVEIRKALIKEILGTESTVLIEPPFYFCYGRNITFGAQVYVNMSCHFIDDGKISIGDQTMIGPNVTLVTVGHPFAPQLRKFMYTEPITIEENCWIGANVTVLPGVTIGANSVIGAGSVVTKSIPPNVIALGNPCVCVRSITEEDNHYYRKGMRITKEELKEIEVANQKG